MAKQMLDYDPVIFLRCHSNRYDPKTDIQTKVWHTEFEPHPEKLNENSNFVATSGGQSICFTDVTQGKVLKKYYSKNNQEIFYCFTWTSIPHNESEHITVLVAGTSVGRLHVIYVSQNIAIGEVPLVDFKKSKKKKCAVNSVCVCKDQNSGGLLCGMSDGTILAVEMKSSGVESDIKCDITICRTLSVENEVFQITFCPTTRILLAACGEGLFGIPVPSWESLKHDDYQVTKFLPSKEYQKEGCELVDTVQSVSNGLISARYVLRGAIYIFDLKPISENGWPSDIEFTPIYVLKWSDTDNYFMNIGVSKAANVLACGDDRGTIWLYDTKFMEKGGATTKVIPPTNKIEWPIVNDKYSTKKKKLKLDVYDIVINKVAIHSSGKYIVAVTDNNTVCLWKRVES